MLCMYGNTYVKMCFYIKIWLYLVDSDLTRCKNDLTLQMDDYIMYIIFYNYTIILYVCKHMRKFASTYMCLDMVDIVLLNYTKLQNSYNNQNK